MSTGYVREPSPAGAAVACRGVAGMSATRRPPCRARRAPAGDTLEHVDRELVAEIVRMNVAAAAAALR